MTIEEVFKLIKCKKNNSRKSKCDIATLLGTECSCIEYFNFEEYLYLIFISVLLLSLIQLFARMLPEYVSANKKFDLIIDNQTN